MCLWSVSGAARNETLHKDDNCFGTQRCAILSLPALEPRVFNLFSVCCDTLCASVHFFLSGRAVHIPSQPATFPMSRSCPPPVCAAAFPMALPSSLFHKLGHACLRASFRARRACILLLQPPPSHHTGPAPFPVRRRRLRANCPWFDDVFTHVARCSQMFRRGTCMPAPRVAGPSAPARTSKCK